MPPPRAYTRQHCPALPRCGGQETSARITVGAALRARAIAPGGVLGTFSRAIDTVRLTEAALLGAPLHAKAERCELRGRAAQSRLGSHDDAASRPRLIAQSRNRCLNRFAAGFRCRSVPTPLTYASSRRMSSRVTRHQVAKMVALRLVGRSEQDEEDRRAVVAFAHDRETAADVLTR